MKSNSKILPRRWLSPQRIGFSMILVVLVWGMYLLTATHFKYFSGIKESDYLKSEIIALSKKYVHALSKEERTTELGSTNTQQTALLLQNMLSRIEQLETQMDDVIMNSTKTLTSMAKFIRHLNDSFNNRSSFVIENYCEIPQDHKYPHCEAKVEWLKDNWKKSKKFTNNGVNGTVCSFLAYLSQVEEHCPKNFVITRKRVRSGLAGTSPSNYDAECQSYIEDAAYPHCKSKVKWMHRFWNSDPVYASHGVNGSLCSFVKYLSEVESWCPLMKGQVSLEEHCDIPKDPAFPHCGDKVMWMRKFWTSDKCYREYGVNGSVCSFLVYLSEMESWCPLPAGAMRITPVVQKLRIRGKANLSQTNLADLLKILQAGNDNVKYTWMSERISRLWPDWKKGLNSLKTRLKLDSSPRKKILIYLGFLADEPLYHFGASAGKGGPLGELLQWSDIIASLHLLGHKLVVSMNKSPKDKLGLKSLISGSLGGSCPNTKSSEFDLIYTDYIGLSHMLRLNSNIGNLKCHLRIIDSFGTQVQFNHKLDGTKKNIYGYHNLNLKQYYTMFPHSPDNTFIGFVVENHVSSSEVLKKKKIALVYGKHISMWQDHKKIAFLDVIQRYFEVHATVGDPSGQKSALKYALPSYVKNHGVLKGADLQKLLRETTLFVGLGFPYEGPAPLEAIANGCFFLNAKLVPPLGRENDNFFKAKPTLRKLTSQHPYAEHFIGKPHVYTIDIKNITAVQEMMDSIADKQLSPYLPFEYTYEGMLERVYALTKYQEFCHKTNVTWPPLSARQVILGEADESCDDVCFKKGFICEPAYFPTVNNKQSLMACPKFKLIPSIVAPGISVGDDLHCLLQMNPLLYSCTGKSRSTKRLCTCRDFIKGQTALCKDCLATDTYITTTDR